MIKQGKILIFHLSRFGYADYAAGMINHLPLNNCLIFLSKFHSVPVKNPYKLVTTYRNGWEFGWSSLFQLPVLLWQLYRLAATKEAKVAYFPGFHYWDLPIILCCRANRIKIVYTVHDGILHVGEQSWSHSFLQNTCIRKADELIFLTDYMKRETLKSLKLEKPAAVISHGPIETPFCNTIRRHSPKLKLLFLGRIGKYKGLELLIEAVRVCGDEFWECLTIAGKPLYPVKFQENPKIQLIPHWLTEAEIAELLGSHHVLVLPYISATQSGVVALGISAGLPMLTTKVGGLPEQLADNEAIWVNPDPEEIAEGIRQLSTHPGIYASIQERLMRKKENFKWEKPATQLAELLLKYLPMQGI